MADAITELRRSRDYWQEQAHTMYDRYSDMRRARDRWVNAAMIFLVLTIIAVAAAVIEAHSG